MNYTAFYKFCANRAFSIALTFVLLIGGAADSSKIYGQNDKISPAQKAGRAAAVDRSRLETVEELSESLANDLLELSVAARDRDLALISEFFPAQLTAKPFPSQATATKSQIKWIGSHNWETGAKVINTTNDSIGAGKITGKAFIGNWAEFLEHFSEIEDARFKVKEANFDDTAKAILGAEQPTAVVGATGKARIAFYVIGRDINGKREWARGTFWTNVRFDKNKH